ncbi:MAG: SDR family NAD(P)-dependent oxidoreductase [Mycobacterium sp.]|uniref:SDR family NAD(P)-dependent oxidoreductase n=1 Tax=Mycobacterium sp. TaxID=1785 RepID=UPI003CC5D4A8
MLSTTTSRAAFIDDRVVITGGSQGIGYAIAAELTGRCRRLTLLARDGAKLGDAARLLGCDVCATDVRQLTPAAAAVLADCTLLVCCAAEMTPGRVGELGVDDYQRQMDINFVGTASSVKAALPAMLARRAGTIVLFSSTAATVGVYGYTAYGATKAAVASYAAALRAELRDSGVRVVVAYPPDTDTPGLQRERTLRPDETDAVAGAIKARPAAVVARRLVAALSTNTDTVTFDPTTAVMVWCSTFVDRIAAPYSQYLIRRARRDHRLTAT